MIRMTMTVTALLALATAAAAQAPDAAAVQAAPIVTSAPAAPAPASLSSSAAPDTTASQIAAWIGPNGEGNSAGVPGVVSAMPQRDRAIHGEVGASIGSGGYRSGYAIANMPIGRNSDVTVAIADQHLGGGNRTWGGSRGGDRQSLGIALNLNGLGRGATTADDCERDAPPKWSLGLPDDASLSNRCRRLLQQGAAASR